MPPIVDPGAAGPAPVALLSIADRDKALLGRLARALAPAGYALAATRAHGGRSVPPVSLPRRSRSSAWSPGPTSVPILEFIASGDVRLVVNTPTPRSGAVRDAAEIRHAAIGEGILCLTAIETAVAAAEALDPAVQAALADVRPLDEWTRTGQGSERSAAGEAEAIVAP